jgi:TP901 family phage tail tape measure protein
MAKARAEIEITASTSRLGAALNAARAKFMEFAGHVAKATGKALDYKIGKGSLGGIAKTALGTFGGNLLTKGFDKVVDTADDVFQFEKGITRLGIAANKTPEFMRGFAQSVHETSIATGVGAEKILAGARAYVALTGDMDGAAAAAASWARVAQATDSTVEDIAGTAAALKQNLNIKPGDMEAAFSALAVQGKEGAVELKDLAAQLSTIAPQWAQFGRGKGIEGLRELGAALQVVKRGFGGDASETITGLQSLLTSLQRHAKQFRAIGVQVFEKDGKTLRNVLEIVKAIDTKKLNGEQLIKIFGRVEAKRAYDQMVTNRDVLDDLIAKSSDVGTIQRDLMTYTSSSAGKIDIAFNKMKESLIAAFTPERIETFANALQKAAEGLDVVLGGVGRVAKFLGYKTEDERDQQRKADAQKLISGEGEQATGWRKVFGKALGVDLNAMTPAQRAEYLATQADRIQEHPDLQTFDTTKEQTIAAAREYAAAHGGMMLRRDDPWQAARTQSASGAPTITLDPKALAKLTDAITAALDRTKPTTVKIGDNQVAKSHKQATAPRRG